MEDDWPLHKLTWNGRLVANQPPVVGYVCLVQGPLLAAKGPLPVVNGERYACGPHREFCEPDLTKCPNCFHFVCQSHRTQHNSRLRAPRDSFLKAIQYRPKWTSEAGIVVVRWCKPPSSGKVSLPCVLPTAKCSGNHAPCSLCKWSLCERHRKPHIRTTILRPDYWERVNERRRKGLDKAAELGPGKVRIRLTDKPPKGWTKGQAKA